MRKVFILIGILVGCVLGFALCGGFATLGNVSAQLNAPAHEMTTAEYLAANGVR